ncbi:MAG: clan AA aspartic protease [Acidobacteria bacterium]|nr:clan AA aspartic protease [Acidobacteriota bacterium]
MATTREYGKVNAQREPCIFVEFENGKNVEVLIDTGFNGALCLPRSLMPELGLKKISEEEIFGIGLHTEVVDIAIAKIMWFGRETEIAVIINDGDDRLLGSELLDEKILNINYRKKKVSIADR